MSIQLPTGFAALEPFVAIWAVEGAQNRDDLRTYQSADARQAFYDAMKPLLAPALDRLNQVPLASHDAQEKALMLLSLAYAHVASAIEVHGADEAKHAINRRALRITAAPADIKDK